MLCAMRIICDAHLDLAINAVSFDRDLTKPLDDINEIERHMNDHKARGSSTVSLPEMRRGGVALCLGTLLARAELRNRPRDGFLRVDFDHGTRHAASSEASAQLAYYRILERLGEIALIKTKGELETHWKRWSDQPSLDEDSAALPVGIVLSAEGSDPILGPSDCERWWDEGLRVASLVHYGGNEYADGTGKTGPITDLGRAMLDEFKRLGMILDITHLSDAAFFEALEYYEGPLLATHNNCRALVPGQRQYSDDQIRLVSERGGLICVALDAWMLHPGWVKGSTDPSVVTTRAVADHIEHVISVTGTIEHVAIGSDLDGGYGTEQTPGDVKTIADLQKIATRLEERGYGEKEVSSVMSENLREFLHRNLPA